MPNGGGGPSHQPMPAPGAVPLLPNQGRVIDTGSIRILCVADVRGKLTPMALHPSISSCYHADHISAPQ